MSIDERLERLTERHEALTQSVELMHRDWESRWANIATALEHDGENIRALARIAEIHERRLSQIEGLTE
jgi:ActR/RegA family two-component response regulator